MEAPTHYGIGIVVFPTSWLLGVVRNRDDKKVFAIGPLRFCWHKVGDA